MNGPMWNWFGLSYSSYLVIPRTLLCGMPEDWQAKFAALLDECRNTYDSSKIEDDYAVKLRGEGGRFKKDLLADYRHPPKLPYLSEPVIKSDENAIEDRRPICLQCRKRYMWKNGGAFCCNKCLSGVTGGLND